MAAQYVPVISTPEVWNAITRFSYYPLTVR